MIRLIGYSAVLSFLSMGFMDGRAEANLSSTLTQKQQFQQQMMNNSVHLDRDFAQPVLPEKSHETVRVPGVERTDPATGPVSTDQGATHHHTMKPWSAVTSKESLMMGDTSNPQ